ncbi:MAG TPA: penicillin acylase family protein [Roseiflexaceae bacterium]|nr:penicillin acylase family protein [Roseiflexaceae bacterium]
MISLGQIGKVAGILIGTAAGLAGVGAVAAMRRPIPRTSGTLPLPDLSAAVQVIRDRWGVPHIYADSATDLFMAQGYVHAQDRLWQMEFQRRVAAGQLAELFGNIALDSDRFVRILGFNRIAQREAELLSPEAYSWVTAYITGINTFIEQHRGNLPIEFTLLRLRPRPWEVTDAILWSKMMALQLSGNWREELLRARMVAAVGPERVADIEPFAPHNHPLIVPPGAVYTSDLGTAALELADNARRFISDNAGQGSNSWVTTGSRNASGMPLLANDPHLAISMPSLWYENHLSGGEFHVTGASIPGMPGVILGHNEHIAWGMTNGMNDVQDLYIERFDPDDPARLRYEYQGQWEQAELIREEISVRGQREVVIEDVRITRHGPIINPLIPSSSGNGIAHDPPLALCWTALTPGRMFDATFSLNRAHNWETFRAALADWSAPTQNVSYADVDGHIGYTLAGWLPIRAAGDGRLPVPGWSAAYEWLGMIPANDLPHALDPHNEQIVTANNQIVADDFPYSLPGEYLNGYRAERIQHLLDHTAPHDIDSFARLQADQLSLPGLQLAALAGRLPASTLLAQQARDMLAAWDGELTAESAAGLIATRLRRHLQITAHADLAEPLRLVTGLGVFAGLPGYDLLNRTFPHLLNHLATRHDAWLPGNGQSTWDDLLARAWAATLTELQAEFGEDPATWQYGRSHMLQIRHALGSLPGLASLLNRGPFPYGGDSDTVNVGNFPHEYAGPPYYVASSYRQICDLSDWDRSRSIHATGQSGHPGSRHYADFIPHWLNAQYHPMCWSRTRVEEVAATRMTLSPAL